jgi:hypothetical protein
VGQRDSSKKLIAESARNFFFWEIWKERNARVIRNQYSTFAMVLPKIKDEALMWYLAGAKALTILMSRE